MKKAKSDGRDPRAWLLTTEDANKLASRRKSLEKFDPRTCRLCGCTENDCRQCISKTGQPCYWVEDDLCSACVSVEEIAGKVISWAHWEAIYRQIHKTHTLYQKLLLAPDVFIPELKSNKLYPLFNKFVANHHLPVMSGQLILCVIQKTKDSIGRRLAKPKLKTAFLINVGVVLAVLPPYPQINEIQIQ